MRRLGAVTIGQSPRSDLIPEMAGIIGGNVEIVEAGALDGLSKGEISELIPRSGDSVLVTRLADGSPVQIAERLVIPMAAERIGALFASGVDIVLALCTGKFPDIAGDGLVLYPQKILFNVISALGAGTRLGVLVPSSEQAGESDVYWRRVGAAVRSVPASPYADGPGAVKHAATELAEWGVQLTVMDCMGYTGTMGDIVRKATGKPVVLARSIVARLVAELIA